MDRLTTRQREIAVLRCRDDLTNKEVAMQLGIAASTVKGQWTDAMRRLGTQSIARSCYLIGQADALTAMRVDEV